MPPIDIDQNKGGAEPPPPSPGGWRRTMLAVPAFLLLLLASYGAARGLAQLLAPADAWIDAHVVRPAAGAGSPGRGEPADVEQTQAPRHDGP